MSVYFDSLHLFLEQMLSLVAAGLILSAIMDIIYGSTRRYVVTLRRV